jgi:hypothetical protein
MNIFKTWGTTLLGRKNGVRPRWEDRWAQAWCRCRCEDDDKLLETLDIDYKHNGEGDIK